MSEKNCKKCGAVLPAGYQHKLCQICMAKKAHKIRNIGVAVAGGLAAVGGIVLTVVKKAMGK